MLAYAFQILKEQSYRKLATENFYNIDELCAAIISKAISLLIKRGIGREYIEQSESLSLIRGRIEITQSIKTMSHINKKLICSYDDFSENSYTNKIIKTTIFHLLRKNIDSQYKKSLKRLIGYFNDVDFLDINSINWNIKFNRNNQHYQLILYICYLFINKLLQNKSDGKNKTMDFFDEQSMCRLYEKFILKYYQKEFPKISAKSSKIPWAIENTNANYNFLPDMQSDIMLTNKNKVLIIDAKYYSQSTIKNFDKDRLHSSNLYQIFTYVKNKAYESPDKIVSGMLLYAKTNDTKLIKPLNYKIAGNNIHIETLDLNCDFNEIKGQLNEIAKLIE